MNKLATCSIPEVVATAAYVASQVYRGHHLETFPVLRISTWDSLSYEDQQWYLFISGDQRVVSYYGGEPREPDDLTYEESRVVSAVVDTLRYPPNEYTSWVELIARAGYEASLLDLDSRAVISWDKLDTDIKTRLVQIATSLSKGVSEKEIKVRNMAETLVVCISLAILAPTMV
jgi:hypothetical protein